MQNLKLSEADTQDLAGVITEFVCRFGSCHKEMDLLAKRFEIDLMDTYVKGSSSISSRAYAFLHYSNGTPKLLEVLDFILQKGFGPKAFDFETSNRILTKYGFEIVSSGNAFKLLHKSLGLVEQQRQASTSWIEQHANPKVLEHLKDAKDNLGKGRFDYVLDDCRKAMEALTTGSVGFSDSLTELVNEKIIVQGDKNRKMDAEPIRATYGYCSTLGAHSQHGGIKPDIEQAVKGLQDAESCINFLLKRLEQAKQAGKKLRYWALP
jgi:hypothetical protein